MFLITFFFFEFLKKCHPTSPVIQTHNLLMHKEIPTESRVSTSVVQKTPFQRWQKEANKAEALKKLFDDINSTEDSVHEYRSLYQYQIRLQEEECILSTLHREVYRIVFVKNLTNYNTIMNSFIKKY